MQEKSMLKAQLNKDPTMAALVTHFNRSRVADPADSFTQGFLEACVKINEKVFSDPQVLETYKLFEEGNYSLSTRVWNLLSAVKKATILMASLGCWACCGMGLTKIPLRKSQTERLNQATWAN